MSTRELEDNYFHFLCEDLELNCPQSDKVFIAHERFACPTRPKGYGPRLGCALQHNTHVKILDLNLRYFMKQDTDGDDNENDATTTGCDLFLEFVRKSASLRTIKLFDIDYVDNDDPFWTEIDDSTIDFTPLIDQLLESIGMSTSIKTLVLYGGIRIPLDALANCIQTTSTLRHLKMDLSHIVGTNGEIIETFGRSFVENTTIKSLTLAKIAFDNVALCVCVLQHLQNHQSLRKLSLHTVLVDHVGLTVPNLLGSLSTFLRASVRLRELELRLFSFDSTSMKALIQAMDSNVSITELCLWLCKLDADASVLFVKFVQQLRMAPNKCAVRSIKLTNTEVARSGTADGEVSATMLLGSRVTTAKFLKDCSHTTGVFMAGFCSVIMNHSSQVYVQSLQFPNMNSKGWAALTECIPSFVRLKELSFPPFSYSLDSTSTCSADFVRSLRQNGSIHQVKIYEKDSTLPYDDLRGHEFCEDEEHFITAYCQRNQCLLQPQQLIDARTQGRRTLRSTRSQCSGVLLFPGLFRCAQDTPRMGPHSIFLGLLSAADHLGPYPMNANASDSQLDRECTEDTHEKRKKARKI